MNKVFLSGNLTRDAEVRYSQSGKAFARMGIAVNRPFSKEKVTDFFNMTAFGKTAEFCGRYMTKGARVLVEGSIQTDNYDSKDGNKVYSVNDGGGDYSKPSSDGGGYSERRAPTPPSKNDDWGGEPIDPEDTPF